jgi:hypothetical protein
VASKLFPAGKGLGPLLTLSTLERWVGNTTAARGMRVRTRGKSVTLSRVLRGSREADDRLKFTQLGPRLYSLHAADWRGRWTDTGMRGDLAALLAFVEEAMPHLLAAHPDNVAGRNPPRTSDRRH